jgi:hypothetical protein
MHVLKEGRPRPAVKPRAVVTRPVAYAKVSRACVKRAYGLCSRASRDRRSALKTTHATLVAVAADFASTPLENSVGFSDGLRAHPVGLIPVPLQQIRAK